MRLNSCVFVLAISLLGAHSAHADELGSLRATLTAMHATTSFAGSLVVQNTTRSGDEDKPKTTHAQLTLSVNMGPDGMQLGYANALLERAADESIANAKNPDKPTPIGDLLGNITPLSVQSAVDFSPSLLRRLEGATLTGQRDENHDGVATHLLVFSVPAGVGKGDRDAIKHYEGVLKVWLGKDGVPRAVAESRTYKGRKFFISFESSSSMSATLRPIGQRLVAVSTRRESKGSGLGQSNASVTTTSLAVQPTTKAAGSAADQG